MVRPGVVTIEGASRDPRVGLELAHAGVRREDADHRIALVLPTSTEGGARLVVVGLARRVRSSNRSTTDPQPEISLTVKTVGQTGSAPSASPPADGVARSTRHPRLPTVGAGSSRGRADSEVARIEAHGAVGERPSERSPRAARSTEGRRPPPRSTNRNDPSSLGRARPLDALATRTHADLLGRSEPPPREIAILARSSAGRPRTRAGTARSARRHDHLEPVVSVARNDADAPHGYPVHGGHPCTAPAATDFRETAAPKRSPRLGGVSGQAADAFGATRPRSDRVDETGARVDVKGVFDYAGGYGGMRASPQVPVRLAHCMRGRDARLVVRAGRDRAAPVVEAGPGRDPSGSRAGVRELPAPAISYRPGDGAASADPSAPWLATASRLRVGAVAGVASRTSSSQRRSSRRARTTARGRSAWV